MSNVTLILSQIESGDPSASEKLLPLVYEELRNLAAIRLRAENPGHSLNATALDHVAYLRLGEHSFESRTHFLRVAAECMRRILVDHARSRNADKRGGGRQRVSLDESVRWTESADHILALEDAQWATSRCENDRGSSVRLMGSEEANDTQCCSAGDCRR